MFLRLRRANMVGVLALRTCFASAGLRSATTTALGTILLACGPRVGSDQHAHSVREPIPERRFESGAGGGISDANCIVTLHEGPPSSDTASAKLDSRGRVGTISAGYTFRYSWDGDRLVRIETLEEDGSVDDATHFTYGPHAELLRVGQVDSSVPTSSQVRWRATYDGEFGELIPPGPLRSYRLLSQGIEWPAFDMLYEIIARPVFTGSVKIVVAGWPDATSIRCTLHARGPGECHDEYDRTAFFEGPLLVRWEHAVADTTTGEKTRRYRREGSRLVAVVARNTDGQVVHRRSYRYDIDGRVVGVRHENGGDVIEETISYRCP